MSYKYFENVICYVNNILHWIICTFISKKKKIQVEYIQVVNPI
jgi:hypothetical protein